jgi:hypothetical protein
MTVLIKAHKKEPLTVKGNRESKASQTKTLLRRYKIKGYGGMIIQKELTNAHCQNGQVSTFRFCAL